MTQTPILDGIRVVDMTQYLAGPTVTLSVLNIRPTVEI
jgi:crotonobetainyl-CoA:carnitine CoA-transferase CaiB-like acyl-CoA transferase